LRPWRYVAKQATKPPKRTVKIGIIAKYLANEDTYMSVFEALAAAGFKHDVGVELKWVESVGLSPTNAARRLSGLDGIVVPGGFGKRGLEGKIAAASYAMTHKLPYLGLCLGLQMAVVAAARQAGLKQANSVELDAKTPDPVIHVMPGQDKLLETGGTMRLGNYDCVLTPGTLARRLYKQARITERHRHRYEVNNAYRGKLAEAGLIVSGLSPDNRLVEIMELEQHPFFIASQFHPEFKSRPNRPHPLFDGFVATLKSRS
jgi:CTP synthase